MQIRSRYAILLMIGVIYIIVKSIFEERRTDLGVIKNLFGKHSKPTASVFVDFEHWCYSLSRQFKLKPDIDAFYNEINEKYKIKNMYFFGDFTEPTLNSYSNDIRRFTKGLQSTHNPSNHLKKDYTDFIMLDYIYQDLFENPDTDVYVIFSGDGHFSSVCTYLTKNKHKKLVIYGINKATSMDLQKLADECVLLPDENAEKRKYYKMVIENLALLKSKDKVTYPTFLGTVEHVARKNDVGEDKIKTALQELLETNIMSQKLVRTSKNKQLKTLEVNWKEAEKAGLVSKSDLKKKKK